MTIGYIIRMVGTPMNATDPPKQGASHMATQSSQSETAEFNLIKSVTAVPSKRKDK